MSKKPKATPPPSSDPDEGAAVSSAETREFDASEAAGLDGIEWASDSPEQGGGGSGSTWFDDLAKAGSEAVADASEPEIRPQNADTVEIIQDPNLGVDPGVQDEGGEHGSDDLSANYHDNLELLVSELARVSDERDQYLDTSRRLQADMENYRKQVARRETEALERANERLVLQLLPVLDACDGAVASGATDVEPVRSVLVDVLGKQGLESVGVEGEAFDPSNHEAVVHEPDDEVDGQVVAGVLRTGYRWKGRVIRPAMVKVKG